MKINDVYFNRFDVPIVSSPNPYNDSLIDDPVKIFIVVNYNWKMGHTGMVVGEGEDALLYDPSGGYSECLSRECYNNNEALRAPRGSGEFFEYPEFNWDDYLSFQLWDGPDVQIIEFVVPRTQAEKIKELIFEHGGAGWAMCAETVFNILKESGGIFDSLDKKFFFREDPWNLREKLIDLHYPKRRELISGAY